MDCAARAKSKPWRAHARRYRRVSSHSLRRRARGRRDHGRRVAGGSRCHCRKPYVRHAAGQIAAPASLPPVPEPVEGRVQWVPHHATQSHILIGLPGIRRDDPDYFPLFVGNHVLGGGGFVSRITEEVRTKRGLAYSAYSYFTPMLREGPFVVGMQTKSEQARDALEVLRKTLADFVAKGPTDKELALAKKNIIGGFPAAHRQQPQDPRVPRLHRLLSPAAHLSRRFREERGARDGRGRAQRVPAQSATGQADHRGRGAIHREERCR